MEKERSEEILGCCACEDKIEETLPGLTCEDKKRIFTRREQEVLAGSGSLRFARALLEEEMNREDELGRQAARLELEKLRLARARTRKGTFGRLGRAHAYIGTFVGGFSKGAMTPEKGTRDR